MKLNRFGYLIGSGVSGIFSHGLMSFATVTIIMACLIIMGSFSLLVVNIDSLIDDLEAQNEVVAFVDENLSDEEAMALQEKVAGVANIREVSFVSRTEAMDSFASDYDEGMFDVLGESVFRHRYVVKLDDIGLMEQTKANLESVDGIAKVNAHLEYADAFISARNIVSLVSLVLIAILIVVSFFIMNNTIKLATYTRREEIAIMKMVGASNGFIRLPFVVEGLVLGLFGSGLAFFLEWGLYSLVADKVVGGVTGSFISVVPFREIMLPLLAAYLGVGVVVGAFGGSSAIRNYLKV